MERMYNTQGVFTGVECRHYCSLPCISPFLLFKTQRLKIDREDRDIEAV